MRPAVALLSRPGAPVPFVLVVSPVVVQRSKDVHLNRVPTTDAPGPCCCDSCDHCTIIRPYTELDAARGALRRIRRWIEAEERPGEWTAEIYEAAGAALPY